MLCARCGREIMQGSAFCPYCGGKVVREQQPQDDTPVYEVNVRKVLKSGKLVVYHDRTEFLISSVQKLIFSYAGLVAVKKEWDHIDFINEDGRKESCPADRKCVHDAFRHIEEMSRPYIAQREERLLTQGVRYSFPSSQGMLNDGILNISDEQAEFKGKSGRNEVVSFRDVKSVSAPAGTLDFVLLDRRMKSFAISKEMRDEVLAFVTETISVYLAQREEDLLSRGIYFSFPSPDGKTVDILSDRVERKSQLGQPETVFFQEIRTVNVYGGTLELALTDGTSKSFPIDEEAAGGVLTFVMDAIEPYVRIRTEGYDISFGIDERIEINETRGVFHIIRQNGREITDEWPLQSLSRCRWEERKELSALGSVVSGGMALFKSAARVAGNQSVGEAEEWISCAGVAATLYSEQGLRTENIWFGVFPAGMSLTNKKYERYLVEWERFADYLKMHDLATGQGAPVPAGPERRHPEPAPERILPEPPRPGDHGGGAPDAPRDQDTGAGEQDTASQQDDLGIARYIGGICRFIGNYPTPVTIAFQGNRGSGENSVLRMLFNRLGGQNGIYRLWFNVQQFSQGESGEALSVLVGKKLVALLGEEDSTPGKGEDLITNLAGLFTGTVAGDSSIGKEMVGGLFNRRSADSTEQLVELFARKAASLSPDETMKIVLFIDGLEWFAPARTVELLEAMRPFFACKGCVFVVATEYSIVLDGIRERYGQGFDESRGRSFFDEMFKMSFRVPESSYNVQNYVKNKLANLDVQPEDDAELEICVALVESSVGKDLESIDRLFTSFHLLKSTVDEETYRDRYKRQILFALLCMQTGYRNIYDLLVQRRSSVTPEFLAGLCGHSAQPWDMGQVSDDEKESFRDFGDVFARIIDVDGNMDISEAECQAFAEVLEFSSITSK